MINVLDHGFVRLVNHMGDDSSIVQAARVSYGEGTKTVSDDRTLIRYLMRHRHTSPFEMVEFVFHVKLPIFVARQWQRHRTGSFNEVSARYSEVKDEYYLPEIRLQDSINKQSSIPMHEQAEWDQAVHYAFSDPFPVYQNMLKQGVAREIARCVLPQATYTEFYWKVNLHNLFHFLKLRTDPHAQKEIRVYAEAIEGIVRDTCPTAYIAWEDYVKEAVTFSRLEVGILRRICRDADFTKQDYFGLTDREKKEFQKKLEEL